MPLFFFFMCDFCRNIGMGHNWGIIGASFCIFSSFFKMLIYADFMREINCLIVSLSPKAERFKVCLRPKCPKRAPRFSPNFRFFLGVGAKGACFSNSLRMEKNKKNIQRECITHYLFIFYVHYARIKN